MPLNLRRSRRVAPEKRASRLARELHQAPRKVGKPPVVAARETDREEEGPGDGACRREVGKIHGKGLVAHIFRIRIRQKMGAERHHVAGDRNAARSRIDDRAVIAHALTLPGAERLIGKEFFNDLKFTGFSHFGTASLKGKPMQKIQLS